MSNPTIRINRLVFGIGEFKDDEDYRHGFVVIPSGILYPTLFVEEPKTGLLKLNLEMTVKLNDVALINRMDDQDFSFPWADKEDVTFDLTVTGSIDKAATVIVQYNLVPKNLDLSDNESLRLVSYQLSAQTTNTNKPKRLT